MNINRKDNQVFKGVFKLGAVIGGATVVGVLTLTGCGSGNDADDSTEATDSATTNFQGGFDSAQLEEIQACLDAAGLEDKLPTDLPTDAPGSPPSGQPGGAFGALQDPEVQAALEACGIDLPQRPGADSS